MRPQRLELFYAASLLVIAHFILMQAYLHHLSNILCERSLPWQRGNSLYSQDITLITLWSPTTR